MWGGRFQVLVATHLNTNCLHNHFVINSVSYIDGKKYEQKRSQYYDLRTASDDICRAHELSVIEQPLGKTPRQLYEAEQRGEPTRYNQMRAAIHEAKAKTSTERDFARAGWDMSGAGLRIGNMLRCAHGTAGAQSGSTVWARNTTGLQ